MGRKSGKGKAKRLIAKRKEKAQKQVDKKKK